MNTKMVSKTVTKGFAKSLFGQLGMVLMAAGLISGCASDDPTSAVSRIANGTIFSGKGVPGSEVDLDRFRPVEFCPRAVLLDGWSVLEDPAIASDSERDPKKVAYQAVITKVARECKTVGDVITVRLGLAGRVTLGPAAGSTASLDLPLTLSVFDRETGKEISSEVRLHRASFTPGQPTSLWQVVYGNISVPADKTAVDVRAGFAPGSRLSPQR